MGVPCVFIRTGGCTLKCEGFGCTTISPLDNTTVIKGCDSIHAVNAKHFKHLWNYYDNFNELVFDIEKHIQNTIKYTEKQDIIFTGGEALLHYKDDVMVQTLEYFISRGHRVFFETNGTVDIDFDQYPIYRKVSYSISVKMSNSGELEHKRWKPEVTNEYLKNSKNSYFKFVLNKQQIENNEQDEILTYLQMVPTFGLVYIMPQGETITELDDNALAVYEYCLKNGFRYSDRIHIRMYNDKRAV